MMSALPATAPPGRPPATILASTHMSGVTPKRACAPPRDQRKPVMTSSRIITTPCFLVAARSAVRKFFGSGTMPHGCQTFRRPPPPARRAAPPPQPRRLHSVAGSLPRARPPPPPPRQQALPPDQGG